MRPRIETAIQDILKKYAQPDVVWELTRPEVSFGDYATNVALQLARKVGTNPRELATEIAEQLRTPLGNDFATLEVAGPGFINVTLSDTQLIEAMTLLPAKPLVGKVIVAEYSDPNPFKVLHAGHFYTSVVGESIAQLLEGSGATVHRVNFGGDVGLHVAKNMWGILQLLGGENPEKLAEVPESERADWLSARYVEGNVAYDTDEVAKTDIVALNKRVYQLHEQADHDSSFAKIYWTTRQWSYDYFEQFYARIGSRFERYYPESETAPLGLTTVKEQLQKGVYKESDGAVVFEGEPYGLHTRVFINSAGLPTYEAKDVGLIMKKWQDYHFDTSLIITANDIVEYMKVVLKSIEQFEPKLAKATTHLTHGVVKLAGGQKMSSRKGNVLRAIDVLQVATDAHESQVGTADETVVMGAIKYAFLKNRIGGDIIYNPEESVSLEGNSGPYLQYAHARACSVLRKSQIEPKAAVELQSDERALVRKLSEYSEVVDKSVMELMPHHICTYLYELSQVFNRFYEKNRVVGDPREAERVGFVKQYAHVLQTGLALLGIVAPESM